MVQNVLIVLKLTSDFDGQCIKPYIYKNFVTFSINLEKNNSCTNLFVNKQLLQQNVLASWRLLVPTSQLFPPLLKIPSSLQAFPPLP